MRPTRLACSIHAVFATALVAAAPAAFADPAAPDGDEAAIGAARETIADAITVIDRAQIERSGDFSVADLLRDTVLAPLGNWRPQSGNSAQSLATIDLRGLGSGRTLVLIDGRRTATHAMSRSSGTDLDAIPLAMVERIEIIPEGLSARYGADAMSGVVNIITRRMEGAELRYGFGDPSIDGGDLEELAAVFGASTERTTISGGAAKNRRGMTFTRDQIGGDTVGYSPYGNSYYDWFTGRVTTVPGFACDADGFYVIGFECSYDFNRVAAHEASIDNMSVFVGGRHGITDAWDVVFDASTAKVESFGRYAPTPGVLVVEDGTPNDINAGVRCGDAGCASDGLPTYFFHRFAAAGNRDNDVYGQVSDYGVGFVGALTDALDVEFGVRRSDYDAASLGRGYVVQSLAEAAANRGDYDLSDPFGADPAVVSGFTATLAREARFERDTAYATGRLDWALPTGLSRLAFGVEFADETWHDQYDSLSTAGLVLGTGESPSGAATRDTQSLWIEWTLPLGPTLAATLAGRHDRLETTKTESLFSPKVSLRWQPLDWLGVRGAWGESFTAPSLDAIGQLPVERLELVQDPQYCTDFGCDYFVPTTIGGNAELDAEQARHWNVGIEVRPLPWLTASADYWDVDVDKRLVRLNAQSLAYIAADPARYGAVPDGLSVTYGPFRIEHIVAGVGNFEGIRTRGVDVRVATEFDFGAAGRLRNRLDLTKVVDEEARMFWGYDAVDWSDRFAHPSLRAQLQNVWTVGDFEFGWTVHHIGDHEDVLRRVGAWTTHDLSASWQAPWNATLAIGATNVGDEMPELVDYDDRPWNFYLYDGWGRTLWARYTQRF